MKVVGQVGIPEDDCVWERDSVNDPVTGMVALLPNVWASAPLGIESAF